MRSTPSPWSTRLEELDLKQLTGRLLIVPVANVSGFHAGSRTVPEDGRDLNRCFPGDPKGRLSERFAYYIFTELAAAAIGGGSSRLGKGQCAVATCTRA